MEVKFVIESAVKQGFDSDLVHAALIDGDLDSIEKFLSQLNVKPFFSLQREVIRRLVNIAETENEEKAVVILEQASEIPHGEAVIAIGGLVKIGNERALRQLHKLSNNRSPWMVARAKDALNRLDKPIP